MEKGLRVSLVFALVAGAVVSAAVAGCGRTELDSIRPRGTGGRPASGAGGALGTGGQSAGTGGASGTGGVVACGPSIDDLESGTGRICEGDGRVGVWYAFNDGLGGAVQWPAPATPGVPIPTTDIPGGRGASKRAMRTYGDARHSWGAGVGVDLDFDGTTYGLYDGRAFDGITFWARSSVPMPAIQVRISSAPTTSTQYGGSCTLETKVPAQSCNPYAVPVLLTPAWTQYWVAFPRDGRADFRQDQLTNVQFLVSNSRAFDFWIDDLAFFNGPAGCCPSPPPHCDGAIAFSDAGVEQAVRAVVAKPTGALGCSDLCTMVSLSYVARAPSRGLEGLECVTNLTELRIGNGLAPDQDLGIADVSPLAGLTGLTTLALSGNAIADIAPLAGLTRLTSLELQGNQIVDITALAGLTGLQRLDLSRNRIRDVTPLAGLDPTATLTLDHNQISTGLSALSRFWSLDLSFNQISDLTPLASFPNLAQVYLSNNQISDLSPLAGDARLGFLDLSNNQISDLSPLATMPGIGYFTMSNNRVSDLGPLARMPNLFSFDLSGNLVRDLSPLAGSSNIGAVTLLDNFVTDLAPLLGIAERASIAVSGNPIDCRGQRGTIIALAARGDALDYPIMLSGYYQDQAVPSCP